MDSEKIIDLTYEKSKILVLLGGFLYDKFTDFCAYRFSCLRDQDNQLKKRRIQDMKVSRLYLDFCEK